MGIRRKEEVTKTINSVLIHGNLTKFDVGYTGVVDGVVAKVSTPFT